MSKRTKRSFHASINLSAMDRASIYVDDNGDEHLNVKINIFEETNKQGNDLMIGQRHLKENAKDEQGYFRRTPILGNGIEIIKS